MEPVRRASVAAIIVLTTAAPAAARQGDEAIGVLAVGIDRAKLGR